MKMWILKHLKKCHLRYVIPAKAGISLPQRDPCLPACRQARRRDDLKDRDGVLRGLILCLLIFLPLFSTTLAHSNDLDDYLKRGDRSPKWSPLVTEGIKAFADGNRDMAATFFQRAIEKGAKDGLVYFKMGIISEERDEYSKALEYFKLANKYLPTRYPDNEAAKTIHEHIGLTLMSAGNAAAAKPELEAALKKQGPNFTILFMLGSIARQENNDRKVIEYYREALKYPPPADTNPQDIGTTLLVEIGQTHYRLAETQESLAIWNQILSYAPYHPIARQYKTNIENSRKMDSFDEERKKFEEMMK